MNTNSNKAMPAKYAIKTRSNSRAAGAPLYELAVKQKRGGGGGGGGRGRPPAAKSAFHVHAENAGPTLRSWALEVLQVLDKPTVAVCIFIFGVIIIVVASKQLKMTFDFLTYYWGGSRPQDGFIGNFMVIFVFIYVWLDIVILQWLKEFVLHVHEFAYRRYCQLLEALEKIQEQDEYEELQRRRLLRQRKADEKAKKL